MSTPSTTPALGVASEVGTLHTVMVHRPDLAHERLSPSNCHELLFDDVIWDAARAPGVRRVRRPHALARGGGAAAARAAGRDARGRRGARVAAQPAAAPRGGHGAVLGRAAGLDGRDARRRARHPADRRRHRARAARGHADGHRPGAAADRLRARPAAQPAVHARHQRLAVRRRRAQLDVLDRPPAESLNVEAIYRFHPRFRARGSRSGSAASTTTGAWPRSRAAT